MILAVAVFIFLWLLGKYLTGESLARELPVRIYLARTGRMFKKVAVAVLVVWVGLATILGSVNQIPAGHVGVVYTFGAITGQVEEGLQFVAPWKSVREASIQVQGHKFNDENKNTLAAFSQETQEVFIAATLNIRVSPVAIQKLYREVGPNYFDVVVAPRVAQNFKDETVKYKSVDIAPNREEIRRAVRDQLQSELSEKYSIEVVDMLLDDIDFNDDFKKAIEAKQVATQRALEEEQKVAVERHKAEQAVEKAIGQGDSILTVAEKQAEANRKLSESLTSPLIQYTLVQKLGSQIQVMILPPGQNFILGEDILRGTSMAPPAPVGQPSAPTGGR
ncbi:MAG: prohibitin family protein [Minisyncoccia bacterium]